MTIAEKLTNLAELYRRGLDSRLLDQQLNKLLKRESLECQHQIDQLAAGRPGKCRTVLISPNGPHSRRRGNSCKRASSCWRPEPYGTRRLFRCG